MSTPQETTTNITPTIKQDIRLRARKDVIGTIFVGISLFIAAGRLDWPIAWVYLGVNFVGIIVNLVVMLSKNPELYAARAHITQEDTKTWDKVFTSLFGPLLLVIMAVSGLDAIRFGWSTVPAWVQNLSIGLFIIGWGFSLWALAANKHFETSVRIQDDRGHKTVTGGPYAIVRHPGYAGIMLVYLATPPFIGSWWGLLPAGLLAVAFIFRTAMEDRTLHEELPDYPAYAQKVRYRLLPGVW